MIVIIIALEKPGKKAWIVDIAAPNDWRVPKKSKERWTNIKRLEGSYTKNNREGKNEGHPSCCRRSLSSANWTGWELVGT